MFSRIGHWSRQFSAMLPCDCALCGHSGTALVCAGCHASYFRTRAARCARCALPLPSMERQQTSRVCGACLSAPPAFDSTIAAIDYAPPVDQLIQSLKFRHHLALAGLFADAIHDAAQENGAELPELLTPVPLSPERLAERGFNQALEIARPLARRLALGLDARLMARVRHTRAQSRLPLKDRRRNVLQAFIIPGAGPGRIQGRHIGIVDDVMTTGETLHAAAATLKRFGAARVTSFVFARTAPK